MPHRKPPCSLARVAAKMPIEQLFRELHALEFQNPSVLVQPAIQRHADFPRPRKHRWILERGLVGDVIAADPGVAFGYMQGVAGKISRPVEPGFPVEPGCVDNQRVSVPPTVRPSHPAIDWRWLRLRFIHMDGTIRLR